MVCFLLMGWAERVEAEAEAIFVFHLQGRERRVFPPQSLWKLIRLMKEEEGIASWKNLATQTRSGSIRTSKKALLEMGSSPSFFHQMKEIQGCFSLSASQQQEHLEGLQRVMNSEDNQKGGFRSGNKHIWRIEGWDRCAVPAAFVSWPVSELPLVAEETVPTLGWKGAHKQMYLFWPFFF